MKPITFDNPPEFQYKLNESILSLKDGKAKDLSFIEQSEFADWQKLDIILPENIQDEIEKLYTSKDITTLQKTVSHLLEVLVDIFDNNSDYDICFSISTLIDALKKRKKLLDKIENALTLVDSTPYQELLNELQETLAAIESLDCDFKNIQSIRENTLQCLKSTKTKLEQLIEDTPSDMKHWDSISALISGEVKDHVKKLYSITDVSVLSSIHVLLNYLDDLIIKVDYSSDAFMAISYLINSLKKTKSTLEKLTTILNLIKSSPSSTVANPYQLKRLERKLEIAKKAIKPLNSEIKNIQSLILSISQGLELTSSITCRLATFYTTLLDTPSMRNILLVQQETAKLIKQLSTSSLCYRILFVEILNINQSVSEDIDQFKKNIQQILKYVSENVSYLFNRDVFLAIEAQVKDIIFQLEEIPEFSEDVEKIAKLTELLKQIKPFHSGEKYAEECSHLDLTFYLSTFSIQESPIADILGELQKVLNIRDVVSQELPKIAKAFIEIQNKNNLLYCDIIPDQNDFFSEYAINRMQNELEFYPNNKDLWESFSESIKAEITEISSKVHPSQILTAPENIIKEINKNPKLLSEKSQKRILNKLLILAKIPA